MQKKLSSITILIEHHPRGLHVGVAYLLWEHALSPADGLPAFLETVDCSSSYVVLDMLANLLKEYSDKSLFDYDFTVEHVTVTADDLATVDAFYNLKTSANG